MKITCLTLLLIAFIIVPSSARAQLQGSELDSAQSSAAQPQSGTDPAPPETARQPEMVRQNGLQPLEKQPKRILRVIPNYRAVSANAHLPPSLPSKSFGSPPKTASIIRHLLSPPSLRAS